MAICSRTGSSRAQPGVMQCCEAHLTVYQRSRHADARRLQAPAALGDLRLQRRPLVAQALQLCL